VTDGEIALADLAVARDESAGLARQAKM